MTYKTLDNETYKRVYMCLSVSTVVKTMTRNRSEDLDEEGTGIFRPSGPSIYVSILLQRFFILSSIFKKNQL